MTNITNFVLQIAFKSYSPLECKTVWCGVAKKIRRFRVLKEMIADARQWANKPWTNFYSGNKQVSDRCISSVDF